MTDVDLDERVMVAMQTARRYKLSAWSEIIREHKRHPTFRREDWVYTLEIGFTCCCSGTEQEFRIPIQSLKAMLPDARKSVLNLLGKNVGPGSKALRERHRAEMRSRALLLRYLTKQQKWDLKATRAFKVVAKDGRTYKVTEGSSTNVYVEHEGKEYRLCVVLRDPKIPYYDVMLAQKTYLELDPETFARTARVYCPETHEYFEHGGFLFGEPPRKVDVIPRALTPLLDLDEETLENPRAFVEAMLDGQAVEVPEVVEEVQERIVVGGHNA